jgi:hypothetical protein
LRPVDAAQLVICQQHQRAADQVGRMLVVRRPDPGDLQMQRLRRSPRIQHGRDHQAQDAAADHGASFGRAGEGTRIGDGRQRQHRNGAIDRIGAARGVRDRPHFVRDRRAIVRSKRVYAGDVPQQRRSMFERVALGEVDTVDAAIDRAVLGDGRHG